MPITQILLTANSGGGPSIDFYGWVSSMNEGSTNTVTVDYENYPPTTIYWQIVNDGTENADWVTAEPNGIPLGNLQIEGTGSTTFSWTTAEDLTTEGNENYLLQVGTSVGSNNLLNETLTITDTSTAPTVIMSLIADDYSGSGTTWADSSGSSHPGTLINSPTFTNTAPKHFTFNRTDNEWIYVDDLGDLATWTIESWFRISEELSNTQATAIITTTYSDDVNTNYGVINYTMSNFVEGGSGGNDQLTVGFFAGSTWYTTAGFVPTVGEWYHVVGTYDGTTIKQWVNGELDTTRTVTATPTASGGPVRIARRWDGYNTDDQQFFPGDIATAKIYSGVITDEEIIAAYDTTRSTYSV